MKESPRKQVGNRATTRLLHVVRRFLSFYDGEDQEEKACNNIWKRLKKLEDVKGNMNFENEIAILEGELEDWEAKVQAPPGTDEILVDQHQYQTSNQRAELLKSLEGKLSADYKQQAEGCTALALALVREAEEGKPHAGPEELKAAALNALQKRKETVQKDRVCSWGLSHNIQ